MSLMTRVRNPLLDDAKGALITSAVTLAVLGCLLFGLF
jgi:hypothetical protein